MTETPKTSLMTQPKSQAKLVGLLALAAILNPLTGVLGAIPMRTIRRTYGRIPFWVAFLAMSAAFFAGGLAVQAVFLVCLTLLVGVYAEAEQHGESVFVSGLAGVLTALGLTAIGATLWLMRSGSSVMVEMKTLMQQMVTEAQAMNPDMALDPDTLVRTMPSAIVVTLIVALAVSLIWDRVVSALFRVPSAPVAGGEALRSFVVPDVFVWITTASIFAAYYKHGNAMAETIGLNVFYVMFSLYFFQGVAVIAKGFKTFKVGPFWQTLWVLMMIIQFYAVAFVGFADFWIDFRSRFQRRSQPPKNATENRF